MKTSTRRFIKRYRLVLAVCLSVIALVAVGNILYAQIKNNEILKSHQESARQIDQMDAKLDEIQQKKIAEAKKAELEQQEVAAKQVAEEARIGGASGAETIDSKLCNPSATHNNPASVDVVVNKKHCIQPLSYAPTLVTSYGATLSPQVIDAYNQLFLAASAAGQPFYVASSYRSYANQVATYKRWVSISGQAAADTYSARPGYSEHQTGFAFDVAAKGCLLDCFSSTPQYKWLQQYAADYGFIQRYYKGYEAITGYMAEEWHYRYVGVNVAKDMKTKNIKTLEQYWNISGGDY